MAEFMLLLRGGNESVDELTPEQFQQSIQPYIDWSRKLREEGRSRGGNELASGGRTLSKRDGEFVVDGPYAETKEDIGGYFIIEASDEDDALAVARGCPIFRHGGFVEVRRIIEH